MDHSTHLDPLVANSLPQSHEPQASLFKPKHKNSQKGIRNLNENTFSIISTKKTQRVSEN